MSVDLQLHILDGLDRHNIVHLVRCHGLGFKDQGFTVPKP